MNDATRITQPADSLAAFIVLADKWADLGAGIREQLRAVVCELEPLEEQNCNALEHLRGFLDAVKEQTGDDLLFHDELGNDAEAVEDDIATYLAETRQPFCEEVDGPDPEAIREYLAGIDREEDPRRTPTHADDVAGDFAFDAAREDRMGGR